MEVGSKPMLLGMLSPVFYTEGGGSDEILLVTLLTVPAGLKEVELKLSLSTVQPGEDAKIERYKRLVKRPKGADLHERWSTLLPLPIEVEEWRDGMKLEAELKAGDADAFASVTARMLEPGDDEERAAPNPKKQLPKKPSGAPEKKIRTRPKAK
jgi:hypothetical protein